MTRWKQKQDDFDIFWLEDVLKILVKLKMFLKYYYKAKLVKFQSG